jgi:hypothetical protein
LWKRFKTSLHKKILFEPMFQLQETFVEHNHIKDPLLNGYDTYLYIINQKEEDRTKSQSLETNLPIFGANPQIWVFHQFGQIRVEDPPITLKLF